MAIVDQKWTALPVPFAIEVPDRVPKERYFDPEFFRLEAEQLWPRVWQMACRLEEIPKPGDFVEYEILDQSVDRRAHRRRRGARLPERLPPPRRAGRRRGAARATSGFTCPFHGWCYGHGRHEHRRAAARGRFSEHNLQPGDIDLVPVRCETWGGCAWINLDDERPAAARVHRAGRHDPRRVEGRVDARRVVVRLPGSR